MLMKKEEFGAIKEEKITASEFVRALVWSFAKNYKHNLVIIPEYLFIHMCGFLADKHRGKMQKIFTRHQIFFNSQDLPITSRRMSQIFANLSLAALTAKKFPDDFFHGIRYYRFDDSENYQKVYSHLCKEGFKIEFDYLEEIFNISSEIMMKERVGDKEFIKRFYEIVDQKLLSN